MAAELRVSRSDPRRSEPVATAEWCARQGWPVHPLAPGRKTPVGNCDVCRAPGHDRGACQCLRAGRWCHGFHAATLDSERIRQWWGARPDLGVGVATGPAGLVVIDIDAHARELPSRERLLPGVAISDTVDLTGLANGFHTVGVLAALRGAASPADDETTLRVRTPSGGLHVWYCNGGGQRWQCSAGSGNGRALAWQVDVRAHGGYIVAPGTVTPAGVYRPLGTVRMPAPLPGWLARELERTGHLPAAEVPGPRPVPPRARQAVIAAGGGRGAPDRVLAGVLAEVADCALVPEGAAFSEKLNRAAYTAGGLVAAGHVSETEALRALEEAAGRARPGQERRCRAIIRGGLSAGLARPLALRGRV
ncbi:MULTISPECIES: bifunctional DNA primase/polymerase [unclassified Streptomyces]|uniref:bifunctional DNA primase/polymerase n=1 Tax=unclassified Streptomyces TaxID=2593676 RepID=UPI002E0FECE9|nr:MULTISPECIES: bifunctional DNA primase/polymerase [unclassified Streptomyces]WSR28882.1 bifunctional DNA primase/polymerase [Streptomyces sp. NBC_01205]